MEYNSRNMRMLQMALGMKDDKTNTKYSLSSEVENGNNKPGPEQDTIVDTETVIIDNNVTENILTNVIDLETSNNNFDEITMVNDNIIMTITQRDIINKSDTEPDIITIGKETVTVDNNNVTDVMNVMNFETCNINFDQISMVNHDNINIIHGDINIEVIDSSPLCHDNNIIIVEENIAMERIATENSGILQATSINLKTTGQQTSSILICASDENSIVDASQSGDSDELYSPPNSDSSDSSESDTERNNGTKFSTNAHAEASAFTIGNEENIQSDQMTMDMSCSDIENSNKPRSKKRPLRMKEWVRNKQKFKINNGQSYTSKLGKEHRAKVLKDPCDKTCKLKCSEKFNFEQRNLIFKGFYAVADKQQQREYLAKLITIVSPIRKDRIKKKRKDNHAYFMSINGKKIRVCRTFFKNTLDLSNNTIDTVKKKMNPEGFLDIERRGKHGKNKKTEESIIKGIKDHINSFPRTESHYCRSTTKRDFIDGSLNMSSMYKLYEDKCNTLGVPFAKKPIYIRVFNTEFNIGFFKPKKDQCSLCVQFKNSKENEKEEIFEKYTRHLKEKDFSRKEKELDKLQCKKEDSNLIVCCYDLQATIPLPSGDVSTFYYMRKLNVLNFTIYNLQDNKGYCYLWHEGIAGRGANEISTCVFTFLSEFCTNKDVVFYSDNCVGQNKNKFLAAMYLYAVQYLNVDTITHKYLIVGHSQNEGDQMHSLIKREKKRALKSGPIYTPGQVSMIARLAKKTGHPFTVKEMNTNSFLNWKTVAQEIGNNYNINKDGEKVIWNDIKVIKVDKNVVGSLMYKTSYEDSAFKEIYVGRKMLRRSSSIKLNPAYEEPPGITQLKKRDLLSLCKSSLIPFEFHSFYNNLKTCSNKKQTDSEEV